MSEAHRHAGLTQWPRPLDRESPNLCWMGRDWQAVGHSRQQAAVLDYGNWSSAVCICQS
jgi:hypothetical protein